MHSPEQNEEELVLPCVICGMVANTRRDGVLLRTDARVQAVHEVCCIRSYTGVWPVWINRTRSIRFPKLRSANALDGPVY
jgi:hypothetical protein